MAVAFLAGLLSFLSPCVLPLVPSYLSFVTGMSGVAEIGARRHLALLHAALFVIGFSLIFAALGAGAAASSRTGVVVPAPPSTDGTRRPTPIPTLNVNASASPMATLRISVPRPRPAVGDPEAWEGPGATSVASGGPGSMIGSAGIEAGSIGGIVLVSC